MTSLNDYLKPVKQ